MKIEQVIPQNGYNSAKRIYTKEPGSSTITCSHWTPSLQRDYKGTIGEEIFNFNLPSVEAADLFMDDLYYGEYDGG